MYRYRFVYIQEANQYENLIEEHREVYESIAERNKERAARAARLHIDNQELSILRQLRLEKSGKLHK